MIKSTEKIPPINTPVIVFRKRKMLHSSGTGEVETINLHIRILKETDVKYWSNMDDEWIGPFTENEVFYWERIPE